MPDEGMFLIPTDEFVNVNTDNVNEMKYVQQYVQNVYSLSWNYFYICQHALI